MFFGCIEGFVMDHLIRRSRCGGCRHCSRKWLNASLVKGLSYSTSKGRWYRQSISKQSLIASVGFVSRAAITVILWRVSSQKQVSVCTNNIFWMYRVLCFRFPGLDVDHLDSLFALKHLFFGCIGGFVMDHLIRRSRRGGFRHCSRKWLNASLVKGLSYSTS